MRAEAEVLARMAHEETGLGRPEDKLQKNLLVIEKTPGPEPEAVGLEWRPWSQPGGACSLRRYRRHYAGHQPDFDHHQQQHQHAFGRQHGGVQRPSRREKRTCAYQIQLINRAIVGAADRPIC